MDILPGPEGAHNGSASHPEAKLDTTRLHPNEHAIREPRHRLLCFTPLVERYTIASGRDKVAAILICSAILSGEFFLEPSGGPISAVEDSVLMCYRQNLFSVLGALAVPTGEGTAVLYDDGWVLIQSWEVQLSAVEYPDGPAIKLHVTPPGQDHRQLS
jgi:hypothetical protein